MYTQTMNCIIIQYVSTKLFQEYVSDQEEKKITSLIAVDNCEANVGFIYIL